MVPTLGVIDRVLTSLWARDTTTALVMARVKKSFFIVIGWVKNAFVVF